MACVILAELLKVVLKSLIDYNNKEIFCWTDNSDCLSWITRVDKVRTKFVQRRADKIRTLVPGAKWLHCPGKINPADIPSRGLNLLQNNRLQLWCFAPEFLRQSYECWPKQVDHPTIEKETAEDLVVSTNVVAAEFGIDKIIETNSFHSFSPPMTRRTITYFISDIHQ